MPCSVPHANGGLTLCHHHDIPEDLLRRTAVLVVDKLHVTRRVDVAPPSMDYARCPARKIYEHVAWRAAVESNKATGTGEPLLAAAPGICDGARELCKLLGVNRCMYHLANGIARVRLVDVRIEDDSTQGVAVPCNTKQAKLLEVTVPGVGAFYLDRTSPFDACRTLPYDGCPELQVYVQEAAGIPERHRLPANGVWTPGKKEDEPRAFVLSEEHNTAECVHLAAALETYDKDQVARWHAIVENDLVPQGLVGRVDLHVAGRRWEPLCARDVTVACYPCALIVPACIAAEQARDDSETRTTKARQQRDMHAACLVLVRNHALDSDPMFDMVAATDGFAELAIQHALPGYKITPRRLCPEDPSTEGVRRFLCVYHHVCNLGKVYDPNEKYWLRGAGQ